MEQGVTSIGLSCEDLSCPEGTLCVSQSIPSRNLSVAECLHQEVAETLPTLDTFFCSSGATICDDPETEVCADVYDSGNYLVPVCLTIGCDLESNSSCRDGQVCVDVQMI